MKVVHLPTFFLVDKFRLLEARTNDLQIELPVPGTDKLKFSFHFKFTTGF